MKKKFNKPTLNIVKIQCIRILTSSISVGDNYNGGVIQSRKARFSTWEDDLD